MTAILRPRSLTRAAAILILAMPVLWILGVIVSVALKLRSR